MKRILIFHLGSIGDSVVALPALQIIKKAYPSHLIVMLTAKHISVKAAGIENVVYGMNLIDEFLYFESGEKKIQSLKKVRKQIVSLKIDTLVYLNEPSKWRTYLQHYLFFKACGIKKMIGMPTIHEFDLASYKKLDENRWESITDYLCRKVRSLGAHQYGNQNQFQLHFSPSEKSKVDDLLNGKFGNIIIGVSLGAKWMAKDWGDANWEQLFNLLLQRHPQCSLLLIGSSDEYDRVQRLTHKWKDRRINFCGKLSVRESGYALSKCHFYLGHDNGPMHLAVSVGLRCIAIFSSRSLPGIWFPYGNNHQILYTDIECRGCELIECIAKKNECIRAISVSDVMKRVESFL